MTAHTAKFISTTGYQDIPGAMLRAVKIAVLDNLSAGLAGSRSEASAIVRRYIEQLGVPAGNATVFGTGLRVPARFAALANGTSIHADDYDDTFHPTRVHATSPVVAAVLAEAEQTGASGEEVLRAITVGTEVTCKVSLAMDPQHYQRGYHATSTCGVFGAAAAVCNLRRLPLGVTCNALGIAGSESAGLRENFGTMTKPLHCGRAAESGVVAASLAALGLTGASTILEGPRGFFMAGGGSFDATMLTALLGAAWSYVTPGVSIRAFPSGNLTHPAMCKLQELVLEHGITPDHVERIVVRTNRQMPINLTYHRPATGLQGKFSMEFCLAAILVFRRAGLAEFTDAVVARRDIQKAIEKIEFAVYGDDEAHREGYKLLTSFLEIRMTDGRTFSARVDAAKGTPDYPMSDDEFRGMFRDRAAHAGLPSSHIAKLFDMILKLEAVGDVRELTELLQGAN